MSSAKQPRNNCPDYSIPPNSQACPPPSSSSNQLNERGFSFHSRELCPDPQPTTGQRKGCCQSAQTPHRSERQSTAGPTPPGRTCWKLTKPGSRPLSPDFFILLMSAGEPERTWSPLSVASPCEARSTGKRGPWP